MPVSTIQCINAPASRNRAAASMIGSANSTQPIPPVPVAVVSSTTIRVSPTSSMIDTRPTSAESPARDATTEAVLMATSSVIATSRMCHRAMPTPSISNRLGSITYWLTIMAPTRVRTRLTALAAMAVWRRSESPLRRHILRMFARATANAPRVVRAQATRGTVSPRSIHSIGRPTRGTTSRATPSTDSTGTGSVSGVGLASPFVT